MSRSAAFAPMCGRPAGSGTATVVRAAQRDQREQNDRRLDEEDRLPAQQLGEDPADGRPERGTDDPGERPDPAARASVRSTWLKRSSAAQTTAAPATP